MLKGMLWYMEEGCIRTKDYENPTKNLTNVCFGARSFGKAN
jgi:hypothetical protein